MAAQQGYAVKMLRALMVSGPFLGIIFVNNNAFQGMGRGLASLILSVSRQGLIFLPVLLIANALVGLDGLIFAQPIADLKNLQTTELVGRSSLESLWGVGVGAHLKLRG